MNSGKQTTIGEVCSRFSSGKAIMASEIKQKGKYPVFGGNGIRGYASIYNFDGECAIIGRQGAYCGNVRYFSGKAYITEHAIVACAKPEYDTGYFAYKLSLLNLSKYQGQSAQPGLSVNTLSKIKIDFPSLETQKEVFAVLNSIDKMIENNSKVNIELEAMVKTIYDYWFLQFNFPDENGKPYKLSGGKMVWNGELRQEIPEGWKEGRLNYKGGDWGKDREQGNYKKKVTCLRGADFPAISGLTKLEAPERYIHEKNKYKVLEDGNLIIEISGGSPTQSTGRICYINENVLKRFENDIITSNFCKAIELNNKKYMYWFYVFWCKLYEYNVFFKYEGKTTGIKNLLFDMLCYDYKIIIPNESVIKKYDKKVQGLFDIIQKNQLENQELASLRDFLLPLLMNGQVSFKEGDSYEKYIS